MPGPAGIAAGQPFRLRCVNEDQARELAGQIGREAPTGAVITAEHAGAGWPFMPS